MVIAPSSQTTKINFNMSFAQTFFLNKLQINVFFLADYEDHIRNRDLTEIKLSVYYEPSRSCIVHLPYPSSDHLILTKVLSLELDKYAKYYQDNWILYEGIPFDCPPSIFSIITSA